MNNFEVSLKHSFQMHVLVHKLGLTASGVVVASTKRVEKRTTLLLLFKLLSPPQKGPVQPGGQRHRSVSRHVPPLRHGNSVQLSTAFESALKGIILFILFVI